jgi:hypothetical protein
MVLRRYLGGTEFLRWQTKGLTVSPNWQEALKRLGRNPSPA